MELATLYTDFHQSLLAYIKSKVSSREDAEDIMHNVFIKMARHADTFSHKKNLKNWVFIVTRNTLYDYYRHQGARPTESISEALAENTPDTDTTAPAKELEACLLRFIDRLPEKDKHLLIASELKGVKQKELAEQYHIPYSSLKSSIQRGRKKLKQMLTECCEIALDRRGNILEATPKKNATDQGCFSCDN